MSRRVAIESSLIGPPRTSIVTSSERIAVETQGRNIGSERFLFAFCLAGNKLVRGYVSGNVGILRLASDETARILPNQHLPRLRLRYRQRSVSLGHVRHRSSDLPITCSLLLGVCGTDFVLRDDEGARLAFWRRSGRRVDVLLSRLATFAYIDLVLATAIYLDDVKD